MKYETKVVDAYFYCIDCDTTEVCNVSEAVSCGHPICDWCHEEMEFTHVFVKEDNEN
jgi:transcription elongation factor Elf1